MTDIEILERAENYVGDHYINGVAEAYIYPPLKRAINAGIAALRNQQDLQWNSVEDMLPKKDGEMFLVLVTGEYHNIRFHAAYELAYYYQGDGWCLEQYPSYESPGVTHWMPLPEPPKEASHET